MTQLQWIGRNTDMSLIQFSVAPQQFIAQQAKHDTTTTEAEHCGDLYKSKTINHHLRGHDTLHIPRVNSTTYGLHSSAYLAAKVWNCLPQISKGAVTLSTFNILIQSWYGETCKCSHCTAECTNLDEIKEPLYIIIYVVYKLILYEANLCTL